MMFYFVLCDKTVVAVTRTDQTLVTVMFAFSSHIMSQSEIYFSFRTPVEHPQMINDPKNNQRLYRFPEKSIFSSPCTASWASF